MKILILSFFRVLCSVLYSQGNLQFNQVITYSQLSTTTLSGSIHSYSSQIYTVPVGKVWKIEKFLMRNNGSVSTFLKVNNAFQISPTEINPGPVWVKEGDQIQAVTSTTGGGNFTGGFFISIIEFNIIP